MMGGPLPHELSAAGTGSEGVDRLTPGNPRAVTAVVGSGQGYRAATGRGGDDRSRTRPGEQQSILTFEETMAAYPAGRSAFGRILREPGQLDRADIGARERPRRPGDGGEDHLGRR